MSIERMSFDGVHFELSQRAYGEAAIIFEALSREESLTKSDTALSVQHFFWQLNTRLFATRGSAIGSAIDDIVLGNQNLTVLFDPLAVTPQTISRWVQHCLQELDYLQEDCLQAPGASTTTQSAPVGREHRLQLQVGTGLSLDLPALAAERQLSTDAFIERLCGASYRVMFLGFQAGFAYMHGLDPSLHSPRKSTPRLTVPAGSVAIGGSQIGIYPNASPGGWHIVGQLDPQHMPICDFSKRPTTLLQPGDTVRFVAEYC